MSINSQITSDQFNTLSEEVKDLKKICVELQITNERLNTIIVRYNDHDPRIRVLENQVSHLVSTINILKWVSMTLVGIIITQFFGILLKGGGL